MSEPQTEPQRVEWSRRYAAAMRRFLRQGKSGSLASASRLGRQAAALGWQTLDVAWVHKQALNTATPPEEAPGNTGQERLERTGAFFKETIVPIEATHRAARKAVIRIHGLTRTVRQRAAESSASDVQLKKAIAQREAVEASAHTRAVRHEKLLAEAQRIQKRLRDQIRGITSQQEGERKRVGDELRNGIAQALLAIDLSLLALKTAGRVHTDKIEKNIDAAQQILDELQAQTRGARNG